jgi:hypothetical protein
MSDLELERTAMAPTRWIELCSALEKWPFNGPGTILRPRAIRIINDAFISKVDIHYSDFFLVPGGRYLVCCWLDGVSVLDLGYSTSCAGCKLIASVGLKGDKSCMVQVTADGMGLMIFLSIA